MHYEVCFIHTSASCVTRCVSQELRPWILYGAAKGSNSEDTAKRVWRFLVLKTPRYDTPTNKKKTKFMIWQKRCEFLPCLLCVLCKGCC